MNFYSDEAEWKWMFKNAIDWKTIIPMYYPEFPTEDGIQNEEELMGFFEELLTQVGDWTGNTLYQRAEELDRVGAGEVKDGKTIPSAPLEQTYKEAIELGFHGLGLPQAWGGMGLPPAVGGIGLTGLARACGSSMVQLSFYGSIAEMINRFGDQEDKERLIPKIIQGEMSGAMCITEPGFGSDVGSITTTATKREDGLYEINGTKLFITNGGGGVQLVLAKIKDQIKDKDPNDPKQRLLGLKEISMFLVEQEHPLKEGNNYHVAKNEDKMGLHGSFTCEIVYENSIGKLMGEPNQGFTYMLHLMNAARLACGVQALGGIENCLAYVRQYAIDREQFGKKLLDLPLYKRNLTDWETERDALRAFVVDTFNQFDVHQYYDLKQRLQGELTEDEKKAYEEAKIWTRKRTPLLKYYSTEAFTSLSQKSIQALGGYGFIREYPMERLHRDSFAPLLYEGTSQIQALMTLKDLLKYAMNDPKRFMANIFFNHPGKDVFSGTNEWEKDFTSRHYRFKKRLLKMLYKKLDPPKSFKVFDFEGWVNEERIGHLMEHAETLCQASAYFEVMRVLVDHANTDKERADLYFRYSRLVDSRLEGIYRDWVVR